MIQRLTLDPAYLYCSLADASTYIVIGQVYGGNYAETRKPFETLTRGVAHPSARATYSPALKLTQLTMMSFLSSLARATRTLRPATPRRLVSSIASQTTRKSYRSLACGAAVGVAAYLTWSSNGVHMESIAEAPPTVQAIPEEDTIGNWQYFLLPFSS